MHAETAAYHLFRQGRFAEAAKAIDHRTDDPGLAVELAYFLGRSAQVRSDAKRLIHSKTTSRASKASSPW
jgi:hypothetical protein